VLLSEQQQLVSARLLLAEPSFAMLDRVSSTLGAAQLEQWLRRLTESGISYINLDDAPQSVELYDAVLEIRNDGTRK
jgi:ABC-type uncharacterized transport system fused permease/ATPase subunit